jgi:hypothetical protein
MSDFLINPKFFIPLVQDIKKGEALYKEQLSHLGSALLMDDYDANVEVRKGSININTGVKFPFGTLISGSYVMSIVAKQLAGLILTYDDIDLYFQTKELAQEFAKLNAAHFDFTNPMCAYGHLGSQKVNLIYGVEHTSPAHLISRFDIRACSMAIDPNLGVLYVVAGSMEDCTQKKICFNPVPRGVSIRRLTKYIKKGFEIESHQSVFFVELLRSNIYSAELELMTKEY